MLLGPGCVCVCVLPVNKCMCFVVANASYINVTTGAPGTNETYCVCGQELGFGVAGAKCCCSETILWWGSTVEIYDFFRNAAWLCRLW